MALCLRKVTKVLHHSKRVMQKRLFYVSGNSNLDVDSCNESKTRMETKQHILTEGFLKFEEELSKFDRSKQPLSTPATLAEIQGKLRTFDFKEPMESKELLNNDEHDARLDPA